MNCQKPHIKDRRRDYITHFNKWFLMLGITPIYYAWFSSTTHSTKQRIGGIPLFEKEKKDFLTKKDKSRKGSIDIKIKKLVDKINSLKDFYTTSSCAGRILLLAIPKSNKKNKVQYLFCSHKKIQYTRKSKIFSVLEISDFHDNNIKKIIKKLPKDDVWFRVDGAILHVASSNIDSAKKFLNTARDIGFRRSGIISIGKNKIIMELISTEKIDTIVSKNGKLLINEEYFKVLVKEGDIKLEKTWRKIDKLYKVLNKV